MTKIEKLIHEREVLKQLRDDIHDFERFESFLCHLRARENDRFVELEELITKDRDIISSIAQKIEYLKLEYKVYHYLNSIVLLKKINGDYFNELTITDAIDDRLENIYKEIMEDQSK